MRVFSFPDSALALQWSTGLDIDVVVFGPSFGDDFSPAMGFVHAFRPDENDIAFVLPDHPGPSTKVRSDLSRRVAHLAGPWNALGLCQMVKAVLSQRLTVASPADLDPTRSLVCARPTSSSSPTQGKQACCMQQNQGLGDG